MKKERFIMISYKLSVYKAVFSLISVHRLDTSIDIFTFAHEQLIGQGFEKLMNTYFTNEGQAQIMIRNVKVIPESVYLLLKD